MIIAYEISGPDNDSYLYPDGWGKNICEVFDFIEKRERYLTEDFKVRKSKFNFSYTYDSALIVSQKFKDFCLKNKYLDLYFFPLKKQSNLYLLKIENLIEYDRERGEVNFEEFQEECNKYHSVTGANPTFLKTKEVIKDGVYRTDLRFGSGYELSPCIIIGVNTFKKMQIENFRDIDFTEIRN